MATSANCMDCVFYDEHVGNGGASKNDDGLCRFNPPVSQPGPDAHGLWPVVSGSDWCGHFTAERGVAGRTPAE